VVVVIAHVDPASDKQATIAAIYRAIDAPAWAAPNLDALADVLRDLSWREPGAVLLDWQVSPALPAADLAAIHDVLVASVTESARSAHPLTLRTSVDGGSTAAGPAIG
jgi:hypothetical protein